MALNVIAETPGRKWARARRSGWRKIGDAFGRLWYVRLAIAAPGFVVLVRGLTRMLVFGGLATAPFWIDYFDKSEVPKDRLLFYSGIMFLLLLAGWILDNFVKEGARNRRLEDHREAAALEHRNLVNEMLAIVPMPAADLQNAPFMSVVRRTLTAILQRVREDLDTLDAAYLEVSLLLFQPQDRIVVVERADRNRAIGASVERRSTMAYYVARVGADWKHVPDLRNEEPFAFHGISVAHCPYRSILLIPIIYAKPDGADAVGVVTIDSARAYEFWNESVTDRLFKQVMPFVRILAILFQNHPERVTCVSR
jgi:hypothetical protein